MDFCKNLNFEGKSDAAGDLLFKFKIKDLLSSCAPNFTRGVGGYSTNFLERVFPPPNFAGGWGGGGRLLSSSISRLSTMKYLFSSRNWQNSHWLLNGMQFWITGTDNQSMYKDYIDVACFSALFYIWSVQKRSIFLQTPLTPMQGPWIYI